MTLHIYTDGGSKGNPGPASIGIVCYKSDSGEELLRHREDIGIATNNVAEYKAVIKALEILNESMFPVSEIIFFSDSQLLVNQLNGIYKVKNAKIGELLVLAKSLQAKLNIPVSYIHILREKNQIADALVNNRHPQ